MNRPTCVTLLALALLLPSCRQEPLQGPPQIRLGRDLCAECGMIISEEACSSALLIEKDGSREHALFDDIGCMLDYQRKQDPSALTVDEFVHDYASKRWTQGASAAYLLTGDNQVRTPMGSGILAYATAEAAHAAQARLSGQVTPRPGLAAARAAKTDQPAADRSGSGKSR